LVDPEARLCLVGGVAADRYQRALESYVADLGLGDHVELAGSVSPEVLAAYFEAADVFVCLSDHEGFCVPLVEAMQHQLPIVAFESSAVPETLGDAGLLLPGKSPTLVATAVQRLLADAPLRTSLVEAGRARVGALSIDATTSVWESVLERVLAGTETATSA
jgi:glycosyltransferase involved in cell wall biosynthesis